MQHYALTSWSDGESELPPTSAGTNQTPLGTHSEGAHWGSEGVAELGPTAEPSAWLAAATVVAAVVLAAVAAAAAVDAVVWTVRPGQQTCTGYQYRPCRDQRPAVLWVAPPASQKHRQDGH